VRPLLLGWSLALLAGRVTAGEDPLHLPIGDPARREREARLDLDAITDTAKGDSITPTELPARLAGTRLLLVGEDHASADAHRVQLRVLEELVRSGRRVIVGLEMYPAAQQSFLDDWAAGHLSEEQFLASSRWYEHWSYPFSYYREIFLFSREKGVPLVAVNLPREIVSAVGNKGLRGLSPEEAAQIPIPVNANSSEHRRLFQASVGEEGFHSGMTEEAWRRLLEAQCTWDAAMAGHSLRALEKREDETTILVLLAGSGHVEYGLGIARQALAAGFRGRIATLLPVPVEDEKGRRVPTVRASYADFVWGIPKEAEPAYPPLGVSPRALPDGKGLALLHAEKDSPAQNAGLAAGDVLLSLDGSPLPDRETFYRLMAAKRWGDEVRLSVRKGEQTREVRVLLRRGAPAGSAGSTPAPSPTSGRCL
jgi:uncharacterized iron-regulated protein